MSHRHSLEMEVPGYDWDELTEHIYCVSAWRRLKARIRFCKRNNLRYEITTWAK